jgi:hypothetical protein
MYHETEIQLFFIISQPAGSVEKVLVDYSFCDNYFLLRIGYNCYSENAVRIIFRRLRAGRGRF